MSPPNISVKVLRRNEELKLFNVECGHSINTLNVALCHLRNTINNFLTELVTIEADDHDCEDVENNENLDEEDLDEPLDETPRNLKKSRNSKSPLMKKKRKN